MIQAAGAKELLLWMEAEETHRHPNQIILRFHAGMIWTGALTTTGGR